MSKLDKTPLKSKKFIAFIFSILIIAGVMITALFTQTFGWPIALMMSIGMLGLTATTIGYVLSQGALDKFMQGISHISGGLKNVGDSTEKLE